MPSFRLAIILGSARMGRKTPWAVKFLTRMIKESDHDIEVEVLDIAEFDFPVMYERLTHHPNPPERLQEFSDRLEAADALVWASPEYNGTFSPALKNTLDYFYKEYKRKPIGLMTVSSGRWGGINAYHDLQKLIIKLSAFPISRNITVTNVSHTLDEEGNTEDQALIKSAHRFLDELAWLTEAVMVQKAKD